MTAGDRSITADITVAGAGVCGLFAAYKMARLGFDVLVVEAADRIAPGSSSHNEGWLHSGTYHAGAITDRHTALRVVRHLIAGNRQIRALAPECLEHGEVPAMALIRDAERAGETEDRWREAGVPFVPLSRSRAKALMPQIDLSHAHRGYLVEDSGFDARMLLRVLATEAGLRGTRLSLRSTLRFSPAGPALVLDRHRTPRPLVTKLLILATGYMTGDLLSPLGVQLPLRLWKSHILHGPRITSRPVFWLDPLEATLMHHADASVVGLNEDAYRVSTVDPTTDESRAFAVRKALRRLLPGADDASAYRATACHKVDMGVDGERSVGIQVHEPVEGVLLALPGKFTEAPALADRLARVAVSRLGVPDVSLRPWDRRGTGDHEDFGD